MPYQFWKYNSFERCSLYSVFIGTETLSYLRPKVGNLAPNKIKQLDYLKSFIIENQVINFTRLSLCRLCESMKLYYSYMVGDTYTYQTGFL